MSEVQLLSLYQLQTLQEKKYSSTKLPNFKIYLAIRTFDSNIKIWDVQSRTCTKTLIGHNFYVTTIIKLNEFTIASGSMDNSIKIWDVPSGTCTKTLTGHSDCVNTLIKLNEFTIASGSGDNSIKIWDVISGKCTKTYEFEKFDCCLLIFTA